MTNSGSIHDHVDRRNSSGFTLVELLVVISIIALLMSVLMPSLSKARQQAKKVVCQSNTRQWGIAASMYTGDNNDRFMQGMKKSDAYTNASGLWFVALRDYIEDPRARCCAAAQKPMSESSTPNEYSAWGIFDADSWLCAPEARGEYGSYGFNNWCYNEPADWGWNEGDVDLDWRSANVRNAGTIPMLLDSVWIGGKPEVTDRPPEFKNYWSGSGLQMKRFCIDRHQGYLSCLFLDMAVRPVGLKELWRLRWHRGYLVDYPSPVWPEWMDGFKDYD